MLGVKGHGVLTIGEKVIPFENRVNTNFLLAAMNLIDLQNMGGAAYESHGLMNLPCTSFQICSDSADPLMDKIYNRLAFVGVESFTPAIQKPLKVVLRGGGQFHTGGTARSAGFNVITGEGAVGGTIPYVNVPRRQARVRVSGIASLPYTDNWVYHPTLKTMYRYALDSSEIWKVDFDINSGQFGNSAIMIEDNFTPTANTSHRIILTDGVSRLFRFKDNNRNALLIFDLETEQLSEVALSTSVTYFTSGHHHIGWDSGNNRIVANHGNQGQYYSVDPDTGIVDVLNFVGGKTSFSSLYTIKEYFMMEQRAIRRPYEQTDLALSHTSTSGSTGYFTEYYHKEFRFPDELGWVVTGTFDSGTTPGSCSLYMVKEPDTAFSLISIPPTEVEVDTPFSIEYTLEVVDNR